jgi:hypothetical protein
MRPEVRFASAFWFVFWVELRFHDLGRIRGITSRVERMPWMKVPELKAWPSNSIEVQHP